MKKRDGLSPDELSVVTLERPVPSEQSRFGFTRAEILPGRGMMLLQLQAHLPGRGITDLLDAEPREQALALLDGGPNDVAGNRSFSMGGALLVPYANRITGTLTDDRQEIETEVLGKRVRLPANGGGKAEGARKYAIHGLILNAPAEVIERQTTSDYDRVRARLSAGDFGGRWPSSTELTFEYVLEADVFSLSVTARNVGTETLPIGIGWHPYFSLPSGQRTQARVHVPARRRALVNDYDEVLPTGKTEPVLGTDYDFSMPGGRALGDQFLDDCFVDLLKDSEHHTVAEIIDDEARYGLRIVATSEPVRGIQVYAPPEHSFVVLEPQFNLADPFCSDWEPGTDTGMVLLKPDQQVTYAVQLEMFSP